MKSHDKIFHGSAGTDKHGMYHSSPKKMMMASSKAKPNPKAPLGQGGRFAAVEDKARASGAKNPAAVAATVGRKKYGNKKMAQLAAKGRKDSRA